MTDRLIHKIGTKARTVKVYWNADTREFVVKLFVDYKHYEPADYFTDTKADAIGTAQAMLAS